VLAKYGVLLANLVDLLQANLLTDAPVEGGLQGLISEDQSTQQVAWQYAQLVVVQ
jgi:hypothetical protein